MTDDTSRTVNRRDFLKTSGLAGGTLALAGAVSLPSVRAATPPPAVTIGQIAPLSGSAAEFGPFYRDAAQLGVNQINAAARRVLGGSIISSLQTVDTKTLPAAAVTAAQNLLRQHHVPAIVGGWSSGVTVAVATKATLPNGVLQIGNGCTSSLITTLPADRDRDLLFRTTGADQLQGIVAAQLARGEIIDGHRFQSAATLYIDNPYGQGLSKAFARAFQQRGGTIQAQVPHPEKLQSSYRAQLAVALKNKPDVLFVPSYPAQTVAILKQSRDVFDFTSWQLTDGNHSLQVVQAVGADTLDGTFGTAPGVAVNAPAYQAFREHYEHARLPPFTASAYDAAVVIGLALAQAIVKGAITDARAITGRVIRDQLRAIANPPGVKRIGGGQQGIDAAMADIKAGRDMNFTGAAGPDDFDAHGDVVTPYDIWAVDNGLLATRKFWPIDKIPTA